VTVYVVVVEAVDDGYILSVHSTRDLAVEAARREKWIKYGDDLHAN